MATGATEPETELFNRGYEYLFSYKPDKAAETFRKFLKDYPASSARDAALFWLGKTLISLKSFDEASLIFETLKKDFPESPYILFLDIEAEEIARSRSTNKAQTEAQNTQPIHEKDSALKQQYETRIKELEKKLSETTNELNKSITATAEDKKMLHNIKIKSTELESLLRSKTEESEGLKEKINELENNLKALISEKKSIEAKKNAIEAEREELLKKTKEVADSNLIVELTKKIEIIENTLKKTTEEKNRLSDELSKVVADKKQAEYEKEELAQKTELLQQKLSKDVEMAINNKITELGNRAKSLELELFKVRQDRDALAKTVQQERKSSEELRILLEKMRSEEQSIRESSKKSVEQQISLQDKMESCLKENSILTSMVKDTKAQTERLENNNRELSARIVEIENQTKQKISEKTAEINAKDDLLIKKSAEASDFAAKIAELEKKLKLISDEKATLHTELSKTVSAIKHNESECNELIKKTASQQEKLAAETMASLNQKISELTDRAKSLELEIEKYKQEKVNLIKTNEEQKKILLSDMKNALEKQRIQENILRETYETEKAKSVALQKEIDRLRAEVLSMQSASENLSAANKELAAKVADMEEQAAQRIKDLRILNASLSKLMFNNSLRQKKSVKADENLQASKASDTVVTAPNFDNIIKYGITSALALKKAGISAAFWHEGNPASDYENEEILYKEALKNKTAINDSKIKDMITRYGLTSNEADYLNKAVLIAELLYTKYKGKTVDEPSLEILSVDYKPGSAASKTIHAIDLQKAVRSGKSLEEIVKSYPETVKYSKLTLKEFEAKYKERSQIIRKLDFLKNETIVIWSERGYMLIKLTTPAKSLDPIEVLLPANRDQMHVFSKEYLKSLKNAQQLK